MCRGSGANHLCGLKPFYLAFRSIPLIVCNLYVHFRVFQLLLEPCIYLQKVVHSFFHTAQLSW